MLFVIVSGAARYVDLTDCMYESSVASAGLDCGIGLVVNKVVLTSPFSAGVETVAYKEAVSQSWIKLLAFLHFALCAGKVSDLASEWQRLPREFGAMPFNITHCAFLAIFVRDVVGLGEAHYSKFPVLVRQAGLKQKTPRTFDHGAICALNLTVGL